MEIKNEVEPNKGEFINETERLKRDIYRSDMEKVQLFTKILRTNMLLKK